MQALKCAESCVNENSNRAELYFDWILIRITFINTYKSFNTMTNT